MPPKKGITAIVVGPRANQLDFDPVEIATDEVAFWVAKAKVKRLRIEFDERIFDGMVPAPAPNTHRWVHPDWGKRRYCYSGNPIVKADPHKQYKYWQILIDAANNEEPADGRIIINP